jgi:tetratricopeptide (TPR) repeat protein
MAKDRIVPESVMKTFKLTFFALFILTVGYVGLMADDSRQSEEIEFHMQFKEANEVFAENKDSTEALKLYMEILKNRGPSINLLGNIANCYYKANQLGLARLYLERALLIEPNQPDITNNYKVVLRALNLPVTEPSRFDKIKNLASSNQWFIGAWLLFSLPFIYMLVRVLFFRMGRLSRFKNAGFFLSAAASILIGVGFLLLSNLTASSAYYGVVVTNQAVLKQSPFEQAEAQYSVNEGDKLEIIERHSGYFLCNTIKNDGKGWISEADLLPIVDR